MALIQGHSFFSAKSAGILSGNTIVHQCDRGPIRLSHSSDTGDPPDRAPGVPRSTSRPPSAGRLVVLHGDDEIAAAFDDLCAISFWQPMASIVTSVSFRSICSRSRGIAVISLDLASVATWPRAIPSSLAQALTICSGPRSVA